MSKKITVLVDNDSWIIPFAKKLVRDLNKVGFNTIFVKSADEIEAGWVNFMLGCTKILDHDILERNRHNLVVHESDLPQNRGFAPMTWQILENRNNIPICLFEANSKVDTGDIWIRDVIQLEGSELCNEWRAIQGNKTIELCKRFIESYDKLVPIKQSGVGSWNRQRIPKDSELDPKKTIAEQFLLLRVVDNNDYPAFFDYMGRKYKLIIQPID